MEIFTYGTLMFNEVWSRVVKGNYLSTRTTLQGYSRKTVKGQVYPVIVADEKAPGIDGVLYQQVTKEDVDRLDDFEGDFYERKTVLVSLQDQVVIHAETYVLNPEYQSIVSNEQWDPDNFLKHQIDYFLENY